MELGFEPNQCSTKGHALNSYTLLPLIQIAVIVTALKDFYAPATALNILHVLFHSILTTPSMS